MFAYMPLLALQIQMMATMKVLQMFFFNLVFVLLFSIGTEEEEKKIVNVLNHHEHQVYKHSHTGYHGQNDERKRQKR